LLVAVTLLELTALGREEAKFKAHYGGRASGAANTLLNGEEEA
jgi:hypothetical protein